MVLLNFLTSFIFVLFIGFAFGFILDKFKIDKSIGYLLSGFILGPYVLNIVDFNFIFFYKYLIYLIFLILVAKLGLSIKIKSILKFNNNLVYHLIPSFIMTGLSFIVLKVFLNFNIVLTLLLSLSFSTFSYSFLSNIYNYDKKNIGNKTIYKILVVALLNTLLFYILFYLFYNLYNDDTQGIFKYIKPFLTIFISVGSGLGLGYLINKSFSLIEVKNYIKLIILILITIFTLYIEIVFTFIPFSAILSTLTIAFLLKENNEKDARKIKKYLTNFENNLNIIVFSFIGILTNFKGIKLNNFYISFIFIGLIIISILVIFLFNFKNKNIFEKDNIISSIAFVPKSLELAIMSGFLIILNLEELNFLPSNIFVVIIFSNLLFYVINILNEKFNKTHIN